jgi:hypothetical protein
MREGAQSYTYLQSSCLILVVILIVVYRAALLFLLGSNSLILLLIYLEILSWVFTIIMPPYISIKYLIIQAYFMILGLVGLLWYPLLLTLSFFLKIGLPPIHIWFMKLSFFMKKWIFLIFSTLHKLLPLFLLGIFLIRRIYLVWVLLLAAGSLIFQVFEFFLVLLTSSIVHSSWTLLAFQFDLKLRLRYWILYSLIFLVFLSTIHFFTLARIGIEQSSSTIVIWLILSGLPPFTMFWLKIWVFLRIVQVSENLRLLLIFISVIALTSYFRAFHVSLRLTYNSNTWKIIFIGLFFLAFV